DPARGDPHRLERPGSGVRRVRAARRTAPPADRDAGGGCTSAQTARGPAGDKRRTGGAPRPAVAASVASGWFATLLRSVANRSVVNSGEDEKGRGRGRPTSPNHRTATDTRLSVNLLPHRGSVKDVPAQTGWPGRPARRS